jgi:predicted enzyme related to lactoylglutathione lyase
MAFLIDPDGAFVGIWQAGTTTGAQLVNEPGTLGWNELQCHDKDAALAFYTTVFGYESATVPSGFGEYTALSLDGKAVGGMVQINEQWPEGVPSHWHVYFVVADADASTALAKELGGTVHVGPLDAPGVGRLAVCSDSNGTHFSIIELANPAD